MLDEIEWDQDPFIWWKNQKNNFPILSKIARKYLCVSATSILELAAKLFWGGCKSQTEIYYMSKLNRKSKLVSTFAQFQNSLVSQLALFCTK